MRNFTRLTLATTASPNDSQILGAVLLGKVVLHAAELSLVVKDINELDCAALAGRYDISKVSCAIYERIERNYELVETGAAMTDRHNMLVLARPGLKRSALARARIVAAGPSTAGVQLLQRWAPYAAQPAQRPHDQIVAALEAGEFDAGIVHASALSGGSEILTTLVDLGQWWRNETGLPLPLGCYVIRRHLHERFSEPLEQLMRCSLRVAERGDVDVAAYVREHAPSMTDADIHARIAHNINNLTRSIGQRGRQAIHALSHEIGVAA